MESTYAHASYQAIRDGSFHSVTAIPQSSRETERVQDQMVKPWFHHKYVGDCYLTVLARFSSHLLLWCLSQHWTSRYNPLKPSTPLPHSPSLRRHHSQSLTTIVQTSPNAQQYGTTHLHHHNHQVSPLHNSQPLSPTPWTPTVHGADVFPTPPLQKSQPTVHKTFGINVFT